MIPVLGDQLQLAATISSVVAQRVWESRSGLGDDPAHSGLGELPRNLVPEEIHVGRGGHAGQQLFGRRELSAEPDRLPVHVVFFGRPDVVLEPLHERQIVGEPRSSVMARWEWVLTSPAG